MPDATSIDDFWQNILDAKVSIKPSPKDVGQGPINHFWKEGGPGEHTEGYTYAKIGALVGDEALIGAGGANRWSISTNRPVSALGDHRLGRCH